MTGTRWRQRAVRADPRGYMLGERYHEIHPPQQRPLQREKQRKFIAGMRLGVVHDHRHGNADATQRHDHQQVERAWHRTHSDPRGQAAQTSAELHDGDRGSHEPPGQAEQACIGLYWKVATRARADHARSPRRSTATVWSLCRRAPRIPQPAKPRGVGRRHIAPIARRRRACPGPGSASCCRDSAAISTNEPVATAYRAAGTL